jgi:hypothetical protein
MNRRTLLAAGGGLGSAAAAPRAAADRTAVADFTGDGAPDLAVGTGPGAVAELQILDGTTGTVLFHVQPFADFTGVAFVAAGNGTGERDGRPGRYPGPVRRAPGRGVRRRVVRAGGELIPGRPELWGGVAHRR